MEHSYTLLPPISHLELLLGLLELLLVGEAVEVCEHAHDLGEAMHLQQVQELKRLHLEPKGPVDLRSRRRRADARQPPISAQVTAR